MGFLTGQPAGLERLVPDPAYAIRVRLCSFGREVPVGPFDLQVLPTGNAVSGNQALDDRFVPPDRECSELPMMMGAAQQL